MRRAVPGLILILTACTTGTVDLDVSTSQIDIPTTTTMASVAGTTTTTARNTTTSIAGLQPIVPDVAQVVPVRPVLLTDASGQRPAEFDRDQFIEWVVAANDAFAPARIGFSYDPAAAPDIVGDTLVNDIGDRDSSAFVDRVVAGNQIAERYPGELVVLFSGGAGRGEIGSAELGFALIRDSDEELLCGGTDPLLLAHRIGLYLGLSHTFAEAHPTVAAAADTLSDELQVRSAFDGDGFGDTLPDPGVFDGSQCRDVDMLRIGGLEFELPRNNLMSHYPERAELTLSQVDRVRWALAARLENQMAVSVNGSDGHLEAEDTLSATGGPCGLGAVDDLSDLIGYQWVEADHLVFPSAERCRVEFSLPVPETGTYTIIAAGTKGPSLGAVEFFVDGESFRLEDLYAPIVTATGPLTLGNTTLSVGTVVIGIEVVGSNTQSSGASLAVDGFSLVLDTTDG